MSQYHKKTKINSLRLKGRERNEGMCLEREMEIAQNNGIMPEKNMSSVFYTQRKDGVLESTNIRTDKWDVAQKAMSHANEQFKNKVNEMLDKQKNNDTNTDTKKIE